MATKTWISAVASTWATAASWSPAGVPAAGDDVIFNGTNNGQCTVGAATNTLLSLTTTGYTGNLIVNARLTVGGNVTLSASNNISGTSDITITTNSTITSAGATIGCTLRFATINTTIQLADAMILTRGLTALGTPAGFINLISSSPGVQRSLTFVNNGITAQDIDYLNVTDINGSAGLTAWTYKGNTPVNSQNWFVMTTQPPTVSSITFS
jgi:hypothetical protein